MAASIRETLLKAGLPTIEVGGVAFARRVSKALGRNTDDIDLAITLPRGVNVKERAETAIRALHAIDYNTNPFLRGPAGTDFYGFISDKRHPMKLDLFVDGVCDFRDRSDGRGTGCKIYVDDEKGKSLSKEGILLCKLIADREGDREDVATLLLSGFDRPTFLRKTQTQLSCPGNGKARLIDSLRWIESHYAPTSSYQPTNPIVERRRKDISDRATQLREALARS
jgi:hypothetical protein